MIWKICSKVLVIKKRKQGDIYGCLKIIEVISNSKFKVECQNCKKHARNFWFLFKVNMLLKIYNIVDTVKKIFSVENMLLKIYFSNLDPFK